MMEDYIARSENDRKKMACIKQEKINKFGKLEINTTGKHAVMKYKIEECYYIDEKLGFISQVKCLPHTGRMHQIRIQLASRKLPIINDFTYGKKQISEIENLLGNRIALHSKSIKFLHPITTQEIYIEAPIPIEFTNVIEYISNKNKNPPILKKLY